MIIFFPNSYYYYKYFIPLADHDLHSSTDNSVSLIISVVEISYSICAVSVYSAMSLDSCVLSLLNNGPSLLKYFVQVYGTVEVCQSTSFYSVQVAHIQMSAPNLSS